jgi:AraC-like DNA-binding protein
MTTAATPTQFIKSLGDDASWVHGQLHTPVTGVQGPMIIGAGWMLEMVRVPNGARTIGLFLAPFGIVTFDILEFNAIGKAEFVGLSMTRKSPPAWLQTSMIFDMGNVPLATSPGELLRLFANPSPGTSIDATPAPSPLSRRARRRICETYREDVPISEIARSLGVSHAHLTRQFKSDFGFTPINYRHRLRISDAMGRLFKGDDILDVGQDVGFNDTSRFYHDFRKITGTSPGKCRL